MDDQAVRAHLDDDGWHVLEEPDEFVQMGGQDLHSHRLEASEPHVAPEGVPAPTKRKLSVVGDDDRTLLVGVDGDVVVLSCLLAGQTSRSRRPAFVPMSMEEDTDRDVDVVVEQKAHSPGNGDAGLPARGLDVFCGQLRVGRQDLSDGTSGLEEGNDRRDGDPSPGEDRL